MSGSGGENAALTNGARICSRKGCSATVNKRTAKYCSIRCCAIDPERRERLRLQTRRATARPLSMTHQLSLSINGAAQDPEAQLAQISEGREDIPAGMSRLAG